MKTILFTNARNEQNIIEWISHHRRLGFTNIVIFDHKSIHPIYGILQKSGINLSNIRVIRINGDIIKTKLMGKALAIAIKMRCDWMLYLDCDEFLVLNKDTNIATFAAKYMKYDQVAINWLFFGSNYRENILDSTESIIQTYTRSQSSLNFQVKSLLNLRQARKYNNIRIPNPHCYVFNNMQNSINVNYKHLNPNEPHFCDTKEDYRTITAYIAHYVHQSYDEYIKRKIKLPRDDVIGAFRGAMSPSEFHSLYNEIENTRVSDKYAITTQQQYNTINNT